MEAISKLLSSRDIMKILRIYSLSSRQGKYVRDTFLSLFAHPPRQDAGRDPVPGHGRAPGLPLLRRARDEGDVRSVLGQGGEYVVHLEYADQGDSASVSRFRPGIILVIFLLDEYFFGI